MRNVNRVVMTAALCVVAAAAIASGQVGGSLGQRPVGQAAGSNRVTEVARQTALQIVCRGGAGLSFENRGYSQSG